MKTTFRLLSISLLALVLSSCDALQQVVNETYGSTTPTSAEMGSGLKEALNKGISFAVQTLGKDGGYYNDPLVKIPFPEEAQFAAKALRDIGLGKQVDDFEKRLNRGAEEGAKQALSIFGNAIKQMTFQDVKNILLGGKTAATDYFKAKTSEQLFQTFSPKIKETLDQVNATKAWTDLTKAYNGIPLTRKKIETDLVKYTTDKAMDGLFSKVAIEEQKIRENPVARTSALLKKVFDYASQQTQG